MPDFIQWDYLEPPWRGWAVESRPIPKNLRLGLPQYTKGKYDVAILHVDGQCGDPDNDKGKLYRSVRNLITDIPVVVINHGTPWIPEYYEKYLKKVEDGDAKVRKAAQMCIKHMKELIGDTTMIVNSPKSVDDWGFGKCIIHGIANNPHEEYWDLDKEPTVMFNCSPAGWPYYYNRRLMEGIKTLLNADGIRHKHMRVDVKANNFDEYRTHIGKALIAVFPFRESPMPRARTEMMLSGCCIVSTKHHNIQDYFDGVEFQYGDGKMVLDKAGNPIPLEDPSTKQIVWIDMESSVNAACIIRWLYENPALARKIGQNGKERAKIVFDSKRYRHDWYNVFKELKVL